MRKVIALSLVVRLGVYADTITVETSGLRQIYPSTNKITEEIKNIVKKQLREEKRVVVKE